MFQFVPNLVNLFDTVPRDGFILFFTIFVSFLVRLWSTYRVRFFHRRRRRHGEINPIGMYDSSNERSQRTE